MRIRRRREREKRERGEDMTGRDSEGLNERFGF